jgi:putative acetyltransferase
VVIREEQPADIPGVRAVNLAAFETAMEADLVDALREEASPFVSLVAEEDGVIIGHIMFSPVMLVRSTETVTPSGTTRMLMGLAPMAVLPEWQRRGVGSRLIAEGLERCRQLDAAAVVVLGHAHYYPRFGFAAASRFRLRCEYDVPDDVFMVRELVEDVLKGVSGTIRYHAVFSRL